MSDHLMNPAEMEDTEITSQKQIDKPVIEEEEEDVEMDKVPVKKDVSMEWFSRKSLYNLTNIEGVGGREFKEDPLRAATGNGKAYPKVLEETKQPVPPFFRWDGAQPYNERDTMYTNKDALLENNKLQLQSFVSWNRVGSKKGWMFNGKPMQEYGYEGEHVPSHTEDGWPMQIKERKWKPMDRSPQAEEVYKRDTLAKNFVNDCRGSGLPKRGGGMAGGYQRVQTDRLSEKALPSSMFNYMGSRVTGTQRGDNADGGGSFPGAGGRRSGWDSVYKKAPAMFGAENRYSVQLNSTGDKPKGIGGKRVYIPTTKLVSYK